MSDSTPETPEIPSIEELAPLFESYRFKGLIAAGGMGAVYEAEQVSLERRVAIKILSQSLAEDEHFREEFRTEAKMMAKLTHPNLVTVFDSGSTGQFLYLVMEFVNGRTLHEISGGQPIDQLEAATLIQSLCAGLKHAHAKGMVHRDIKPANILIDGDGIPKLADFGLARPMNKRDKGQVMGTPEYVAPEVIQRDGAVDQRADIYSVCRIFYQLLTGSLPGEAFAPPSTISDSHPVFDDIIKQGLHPNPGFRIPSAGKLAEQIGEAIDTIQSAPKAKPQPAIVVAPRQVVKPPTALPEASGAGKKWIGIAIFLIVVGAGTWFFASPSDDKKAPKEPEVVAKPAEAPVTEEPAALVPDPEPSEAGGRRARFGSSVKVDRPSRKVQEIMSHLLNHQTEIQFGGRDVLPEEAVAVGGRHFLLIDEKMTWFEALEFCEKFGAQLACLHGEADLNWLHDSGLSKLTESPHFWTGAYLIGDQTSPAWIDGTEWGVNDADVPTPINEAENFLAVETSGKRLVPTAGETELPFLIEWKAKGGEAPGAYLAQLKRVEAALAGGQSPQWPAGSAIVAGQCFACIPRAGTWQAARIEARDFGAKLAVVDSQEKLQAVAATLRLHINQSGRAWVGGRFILGRGWQWQSGEPWEFTRWAEGEPAKFGNRSVGLQLIPDDELLSSFSFKAADGKKPADVYLISWDVIQE